MRQHSFRGIRYKMLKLAVCLAVIGSICDLALGHGRMMEPPARNSMWRVGFKTPRNYRDMGLNCGNKTVHLDMNGGKCGLCGDRYDGARDHEAGPNRTLTSPMAVHLDMNGGKCGLCGDRYDGVRDHEAGGRFAPIDRPLARCYKRGEATIPISIRITAYHKGYFEFHLCENNDLTQDPGNECFDDANILTIAGTSGETKYDINGNRQQFYNFSVVLPDKQCKQCILRWEYTTGNGWGCENGKCGLGLGNGWGCENGKCGLGLGMQEQFINCADVAILDDCAGISTVAPLNPPTEEPAVTSAPATQPPNQNPGSNDVKCKANQIYRDIEGMNEWCSSICREPLHLFCPQSHCICKKI